MAHGSGSVGNTLITNGATLEDCHTNAFVLTELNGLKWCRYTAGHTDVEICTEICEDPILRAYSACLKQDLLCVWRRAPLHSASSSNSHLSLHPSQSAAVSTKIDLRLAAEKELWVFWYGDDQPPALKTICASLTRAEEASWDKGVEYETRLLLFKALHNLIERSLLENDYVRLGRWFVQPLNADEAVHPPKFLLAFSFSFFIHGENNVCVSITVQRQPPVCRLSRAHLMKRENGLPQKVLLGPFCISATLSRQCHVNFDSDSQASKLWREWSEFYPLPELDNTENMGYVDAAEKERQDQLRALAPPRMVEVIVSGVRLKYPTAYVLVECSIASSNNSGSSTGAAGGDKTQQSCTVNASDRLATAADFSPGFSGLVLQRATEELACGLLPTANASGRRPSQAGNSTPTPESQQHQQSDEAGGSWDFVDTTHKEPCGCGRKTHSPLPVLNKAQLKFGYTTSPASGGASASNTGSSSGLQRQQRMLERQSRLGKSGPFHRRQLMARAAAAASAPSGAAPPPSEPPVPSLEAQVSTSEPNVGRLVTTPVTPAGASALAPPSSCPPLQPSVLSSVASPAVTETPVANSGRIIQQQTTSMCTTTPSTSTTPIFISKPPPISSTVSFGKGKRKYDNKKTPRILWKRPRLVALLARNNGNAPVNIGLGLSCPSDEANPVPPELEACTQEWFAKKYQKHELANMKPFSTPGVPSAAFNGDYLPTAHVSSRFSPVHPPARNHMASFETSATVSDIGSGVGSGGAAPISTSPLMAATHSVATISTSKTTAVSLPENIMEDSPTDISNEFLSPPPSHGHDDEANQFSTPRPTVTNSNANTVIPTVASTNLSTTIAAKSQYDKIFPTPPSIEAPTVYTLGQFSPEATAMVVPSSVQRSASPIHQLVNAAGKTAAFGEYMPTHQLINEIRYNGASNGNMNNMALVPLKSTAPLSQLNERLQQTSLVVENDRIAKYLLADTYSPKGLAHRRLPPAPPSLKIDSLVPVWRKSEAQRQPFGRSRPQLTQNSTPGLGLIRPASPFFPYASPGPQQQSAPGSPIAALPPPPPYGVQRGWPSPAAIGSPFSIRAGGPRTPASSGIYDIQSPVSNASSLCHRNDNSVDGGITIGHTPSSALSTGEATAAPEGHGLVLSILMCDTIADLYRDASFDSCPLCVCSMSIMGVDAGVYVAVSNAAVAAAASGRQTSNAPQNTKCTCGFSAVRYRNLGWRSGLFYEDEYEATGLWPALMYESFHSQSQKENPCTSTEIVTLVRYKAAADNNLATDNRLMPSVSVTSTKGSVIEVGLVSYVRPVIELRDLTDMCNLAVEQACLMMDCTKPSRDDFQHHNSISVAGNASGGLSMAFSSAARFLVADWGYIKATQRATNSEACFVLKQLSPILQESMQRSRGGGSWQSTKQQHTATVEGPLTWRNLHRKCLQRPTTDWSGPEPVPLLLLATDRDWITMSPFALRSWDRLPLEPYGQPKDVVYIAVVPDSQVVLQKARAFFRSLSKTYEALRLGRHCPITRVLKDGIMPVSKKYTKQLNQASIDPSFEQLIEQCPRLGAKMKLYAQICRHYLSSHLSTENVFDKSIFRDIGKDGGSGSSFSTGNTSSADGSSSMPPPASIPGKESQEQSSSGTSSAADPDGNPELEMDSSPIPHTVVIYIVDSFTFGAADGEDKQFRQVAAAGLHRCYLEVLRDLPDSVKASVQMEVIPLQSIFETSFSDVVTGCSQADYLRRLAFSVFQQPRCVDFNCLSSSVAKPLTGFGTAASRLELIRRKAAQQKDGGGFGNYYRAYCPPLILAPTFEKSAMSLSSDTRDDACRVLFVSYCLSERQEWLLATATDHQGAMLEDCIIDLRVSNRRCITRRPVTGSINGVGLDHGPEGSMIWESLRKLWNFITALLASSTHPWRLVIGRLGRLGHEELKAWAHFLCRNRLRMTARLTRERCGMCSTLPSFYDTATILSACLISTEPDPSLRLFPNSFTHHDRFGQGGKSCPLSTPEDVSCTHVMVFPTSAAIHMNQSAVPDSITGGADDENDDFNFDFGMPLDDFGDLVEMLGDGGTFEEPGRSIHQQPVLGADAGEELIQLQPLALGYLVSTAPSGWMPDWFWTNRPSGRNEVPVHLRSALHIHTAGVQQSDEQLLQSSSAAAGGGLASSGSRNAANSHPLDSSLTTDVLRYVLETYNCLSWLTFDTRVGDRQSCMPVHIQHLCRLYRAMDGFDSSASTSSPSA